MANNLRGFDQTCAACINNHDSEDGDDDIYHHAFTRKNVFSFKNNPLSGITLLPWLKILRNNFASIEIVYYPRALFLTILSVVNTCLELVELFLYLKNINRVAIPDDPVFIIGHPRTGTTLIHNLLSCDDESFYYCNTFAAGFPSSFLWFEKIGKLLFSGLIGKTRPMDNMPLHFDLPQEDEIAVNMLSGGLSYYMPLWFMKQEPSFRKYLDFNPAYGASIDDEAEWCRSFIFFIKKLTLRESYRKKKSMKRRLLLKSPVHTARIPLLRKLFPRATFIYMHRDPFEVYQSSLHMADSTYWYSYMNTPENIDVNNFILWQFEYMFQIYYDCTTISKANGDRHRCISNDALEISYNNDLIYKTNTVLQSIYIKLGLMYDDSKFESAINEIKSYQCNNHSGVSSKVKKQLYVRWKLYFDTFGYSVDTNT